MGVPKGLASEGSSWISAQRIILTLHQPSPTHPQVTSIAELYHSVQELADCCRYFSCNLVLIVLEKSLYLILMVVTQANLWWAVPECALVLPQPLKESKPQMGTLYSLPHLLPCPRTQQIETSAHSQTCTWGSGKGPQPGLPGELAGASGAVLSWC